MSRAGSRSDSDPAGRGESKGAPTLVGRTAAVGGPVAARRLWTASVQLTGASFPREIQALSRESASR
ncbi:hypothetical protein ACIBVL_04020 [Streptomyces sp. NPDC049687]|uniref:hypothetical protein n=1 Tax=Streptomyces sp. NPDC049687 TaxID=3365596 RepID=UPI0037AADF9E